MKIPSTTLKNVLLWAGLALPALTAAQSAPTGDFQAHQDIGEVRHPGTLDYDPETGIYRISGSGTNMWGGTDAFHYAWQSIQGDFILRAEMAFDGGGNGPTPQNRVGGKGIFPPGCGPC